MRNLYLFHCYTYNQKIFAGKGERGEYIEDKEVDDANERCCECKKSWVMLMTVWLKWIVVKIHIPIIPSRRLLLHGKGNIRIFRSLLLLLLLRGRNGCEGLLLRHDNVMIRSSHWSGWGERKGRLMVKQGCVIIIVVVVAVERKCWGMMRRRCYSTRIA